MGKVNNPVNLLRNELAARDAEIEKLSSEIAQALTLAETQAALITANAERERLLLSCITNALAALERDAIGSARFHLLAANAHPRLQELTLQIETASAAIARALTSDVLPLEHAERVEEMITA